MTILKNKYAVAALLAALVVMIWQGIRIYNNAQVNAALGADFEAYLNSNTDDVDWDNYQPFSFKAP